ncbi:MAG TPA: glycosyltransferase family 39 protein [Ktedonobacterales bacterium]|nr:glycosyltransferase family 39 protein [Ktedonobacterales bacterium]
MASGTARARRRSARHTNEPISVTTWIKHISPAGWAAVGACVLALGLALQTLQGPSAEYDEGVYWQSLRAMANGHTLFGSIFSSQPPLFLLSVYPFYTLFGQDLSAARLALIAFSLAGIAGTYIVGRALGHRNIGAMACILLALDPLYQHGAHTLQAELPSVALQIWAVACAVLAMRTTGRRQGWLAIGAGVLLGCALLIKLFAIAALVPVVLYLSAPLIRRWYSDNGKLRQPSLAEIQESLRQIAPTLGLLAAGLVGVAVLTLLPFVGQLGTLYDQVVRFHLVAAQTNGHTLNYNLDCLRKGLVDTRLIYLPIIALVIIIWQRKWMGMPLIAWALAAFITLVRQQPLLDHHVVLISPALALISGYGAVVAWQTFQTSVERNWQRIGRAIIAVLLVLACGSGMLLTLHWNAIANTPLPARSLAMAIALQSVSAPNEVVLSDDQYLAALANRDVPPQLVDTSAVRITSGYLTASQLETFITHNRIHVILFASGRFDLLPGFREWVDARYTRVAEFDHGGALYLLEPNNNAPV